MAPVRSHVKSRTGCKTCRMRRVKCDEIHPVCSNCSKRQIECIWKDSEQHASNSPSSSVSPAANIRDPSVSQLSPIPAAPSTALDMTALELMHHYSDSTCYTLFAHHEVLQLFKVDVPNMAFSSNGGCLLHAMLACSGYHLHYLHKSDLIASKYAYSAASNHAQARKTLPSVEDMSPLDESVYSMTNFLLTTCAFTLSTTLWAHNDWLVRLRDHRGRRWNNYAASPLRPIRSAFAVIHHTITQRLASDPDFTFPFSLTIIHLPTSDTPDPYEVQDITISEVYREAVFCLRRCWLASLHPESHSYAALIWLVSISEEYLELLRGQKPRALVIAGHFCAIMRHMNGPWWTQRKWDDDIDTIARQVGVAWQSWMDFIPKDAALLALCNDNDASFDWLLGPSSESSEIHVTHGLLL